MKILMLIDKMESGGAETHVFSLCLALIRRGNEVSVASSGGRFAQELERMGVTHICLPLWQKRPRAVFSALRMLYLLVKRESFDVIHSHSRLASFLARGIAKHFRISFVTTVHARFRADGWRGRLTRWGELSVAVSEDLKHYLTQNYSIPPENVSVIPNGIDCTLFCPLEKREERLHCVKREFPRIAFLSRLDADCSAAAELLCRSALKIVERYGRVEIFIGGGGSEYGRISELAHLANRETGYSCVKMLGDIHDVPRFLHSADIFVGVSRAAMEALLCGLSVVLCGNEGFIGLLNEKNYSAASLGNFCARGSEEMSEDALLVALGEAFEQGKEELLSLRERMARECDADICAERTERVYRDALLRRNEKRGCDVLMCGYYGFGNMGDDALLRAAIERAKSELGGENICALTRRGRVDSAVFGVRCVKRGSPLALFRELGRCKYFVFGGGTLLQTVTSRRSLFYYAALMRIARALGARCLMWGSGVGRIRGRYCRFVAAHSLKCCEFVGLRECASLVRARELLGDSAFTHIDLEDDLAERHEPCSEGRAAYILFSLFGRYSRLPKFAIVSLNGRMKIGMGQMEQRICELKKRGVCLLFVVLNEREDAEISERMSAEHGGRILKRICFSDLIGIAAQSEGVYSMRLHALIAARRAGVHFEGFGNDEKIVEFCGK